MSGRVLLVTIPARATVKISRRLLTTSVCSILVELVGTTYGKNDSTLRLLDGLPKQPPRISERVCAVEALRASMCSRGFSVTCWAHGSPFSRLIATNQRRHCPGKNSEYFRMQFSVPLRVNTSKRKATAGKEETPVCLAQNRATQ